MASRDDFELANQRAREMERSVPRAVAAHYDRKAGRIVGAPPARPTIVFSPMPDATAAMSAGVTANPSAVMCWVTAATSPFMLIAKYSPGRIEHAAMTAMTPTHISVIIAP